MDHSLIRSRIEKTQKLVAESLFLIQNSEELIAMSDRVIKLHKERFRASQKVHPNQPSLEPVSAPAISPTPQPVPPTPPMANGSTRRNIQANH